MNFVWKSFVPFGSICLPVLLLFLSDLILGVLVIFHVQYLIILMVHIAHFLGFMFYKSPAIFATFCIDLF